MSINIVTFLFEDVLIFSTKLLIWTYLDFSRTCDLGFFILYSLFFNFKEEMLDLIFFGND
jgi:hypothetical protein